MELVQTVQGEPHEVSRVRHALADALERCGVALDFSDVAVLLTSEVVTNAIRHGEPPVLVHAQLTRVGLTVAVADTGQDDNDVHAVEDQAWDAVGGRGLHLVESLADRWGVRSTLTGKQVWFQLRLTG